VMDSRHPLTPLDRQMLDWFCPSGKPVHVLLTKSDKLSRSESSILIGKIRKELHAGWGERISVQLFSSLKKLGVDEAEKVLGEWFFGNESDVQDEPTASE